MKSITLPFLETEAALLEQMTRPDDRVRAVVTEGDGEYIILGVSGKMGPSLAELLLRAGASRVTGVSRFSDPGCRAALEAVGVDTVEADLLEASALTGLPDASDVFIMAGHKFGATDNAQLTWAMNAGLPPKIIQRYPRARIVYVSSGNVYGFSNAPGPGMSENGELAPVGEYAQSRLGGERMAAFAAARQGTALAIVRLFYATELRYGIIHDIAWQILRGESVDLCMGYINQIWQGDANAYLVRCLPLCNDPPYVVNLTGQEILSVRSLATQIGALLGCEPLFAGQAGTTALLGDATRLMARLGVPSITIDQIVHWVTHWVASGGCSHGKPTRYTARDGRF